MRFGLRSRLLSLRTLFVVASSLALLGFVPGCGGGGGDAAEEPLPRAVVPGEGITVYQVDFEELQYSAEDTTWGRLFVDPATLTQETGIVEGWLNVATSKGWAVRNLSIPPVSDGPFAVYFDLGLDQPMALQTTMLTVMYSPESFGGIDEHLDNETLYPVDDWNMSANGFGPSAEIEPDLPPPAISLSDRLPPPSTLRRVTQIVTNEQCAHQQCMTMAMANALQYIEDMGLITIPHVHAPGLGGDLTFVGQLDDLCGRTFASRQSGDGLSFQEAVDGTFAYLADAGLGDTFAHMHMIESGSGLLPGLTYTINGITSAWHGPPTFTSIWARLESGAGVVLGFSHGSGGHVVRLTGAWDDDVGNAWVRYAHDALQSNIDTTDSRGLETVVVQLTDLDGDGLLNFGGPTRETRFVWSHWPVAP